MIELCHCVRMRVSRKNTHVQSWKTFQHTAP